MAHTPWHDLIPEIGSADCLEVSYRLTGCCWSELDGGDAAAAAA